MTTVIDAHCHIGESVYGHSQSPDKLVIKMKKNGIGKAIIFPFTPPDLDFKRANDYVAKAVKKYPNKFIGFARVDPRQVKSAIAEITRAVKRLKLKGVKMHPFEQAFQINSNIVRPVFKKCAELGVPVFVSAGAPIVSNPIQVGDLAEEVPSLTIIAAHCAQMDGSGLGQFDALNAMRENRNLYVETSGYPETRIDGFYEQIEKNVGIERLVFGSDSPAMNQELELMRVTTSLTASDRERVLGKNISQILKLEI